jgi:TonB family protein
VQLRQRLFLLACCALAACANKPMQQDQTPFRIDIRQPAVIEYHSPGDYSEALRTKIRGNLISVAGEFPATTEAVFSLTLLESGEVQEIKLVKSSGYMSVDDACMKALLRSSPLPILNRRSSGIDASTLRLAIRPFDHEYRQAAASTEKRLPYESQTFGEIPFVKSAILIVGSHPAYPQAARKNGLCGGVRMALLVSPSGEVLERRILDSRPPNLFDQAVLDVIPGLRFQPHLVLEQAVRYQTVLEYTFKVSNGQRDLCQSEQVTDILIELPQR